MNVKLQWKYLIIFKKSYANCIQKVIKSFLKSQFSTKNIESAL